MAENRDYGASPNGDRAEGSDGSVAGASGELRQPRSANGRVFTVLVCPHSGAACVHDDHEKVPIEVVPIARVRELELTRDRLVAELRTLRVAKAKHIQIGEVTLFGSAEAVEKARWTLAHLKGKTMPDPSASRPSDQAERGPKAG